MRGWQKTANRNRAQFVMPGLVPAMTTVSTNYHLALDQQVQLVGSLPPRPSLVGSPDVAGNDLLAGKIVARAVRHALRLLDLGCRRLFSDRLARTRFRRS